VRLWHPDLQMKIAVLIAASVLGMTARAAAAPVSAPALRIARADPLLVQGRHFKAGERVRVTLTTTAFRKTRRATATATGTFTVDFGNVHVGPCVRFGIRAVGSGGSRALLLRRPVPACMPELSP
jgi:hypothetical protein